MLKTRYLILSSAIFLLFLPIFLFSQDTDVIKVDSSLVILNATITDQNGKVVRNLDRSEFKILEEGKEQEIAFFERESIPFAAVILLDTSGSMETRVSLARSAAMNFLDGLRLDDQAAIYNFDTKVALVQEFSNSKDISPTVFDLKADGLTSLNDAIFRAAQELSNRVEKRRAIIVLSDGADNKSAKSADKALREALSANAVIYTVDMSAIDTGGRDRIQNKGVLKKFAERSGGQFISTPGGKELRDSFKNIVEELGSQYTLGFQPQDTKNGKWRSLEIRVAKPNLVIRTRKGYNPSQNQQSPGDQ